MNDKQLTLDPVIGLCNYGTPKLGESRPCSRPATHRACWEIPKYHLDGSTRNVRAGSGSIECCRDHADYYATAWTPHYPMESGAAWIEIIG
jgi:hypothetical protein